MKKRSAAIGFVCLLSLFGLSPVLAQRVVVIGLDGFSTEGFRTAKHPHIDSLFAKGVLSLTTRPVMPSVTLPNWTSHLTGAGPEENGVTSNSWTLTKHELEANDKDVDGYFPSIFKVLKEQVKGIKTAYYYNWAELINSMNPKYMDEVSFEEKDGYQKNYAAAVNFMVANRAQPQLVFLYSVHTDHAGHSFKWMSAPYIGAIEEADRAIGQLMTQLKQKDLFKDTYFLLITDHGGKGNGHGGLSMEEMQVPWAITGPKIKGVGETQIFNSNKNTAKVIAQIFQIKALPKSWTAQLPEGIFK